MTYPESSVESLIAHEIALECSKLRERPKMLRTSPVLMPLRRGHRAIRVFLVGLLHPVRRRLAVGRIRGLLPIRRVAILCTGNICRSPYAEARLSRMIGSGSIEVLSAGLMGSGRTPPDMAVRVADERGLDLRPHRSRLFSLKNASAASLVVVMGPAHKSEVARDFDVPGDRILILTDLDPETPGVRTVVDPLDHPIEMFQESYSQIDRCLARLSEIIGGSP